MGQEVTALPSSVSAERVILGSLLTGATLPDNAPAADEFHLHSHRHIYRAIVALVEERAPVSYISVGEHLAKAGNLGLVGDYPYLTSLTDGIPDGMDLAWYCRALRKAYLQRRAMALAREIGERAQGLETPEAIADAFVEAANAINDGTAGERGGMVAEEIEAQTRRYAMELDSARVPTGIAALDRIIGGIARGQVLTILARTSVGKSAIAQNMVAAFLRMRTETSAVFCSAEMPGPEFWLRQRQIEAGLSEGQVIAAYRRGDIEATSPGFMNRASQRIYVLTWARMKLSEVSRHVQKATATGRILAPQLIVLDYLGLFSAEKATRSDVELYGEIAKSAKIMAKNMDCAVILIAQCGRSAGDGTQPVTITDARNSGEIEEACDFLIGAWRPELKNGNPRRMRMGILKARRCPLDEFDLVFDGRTLQVRAGIPEIGDTWNKN